LADDRPEVDAPASRARDRGNDGLQELSASDAADGVADTAEIVVL
jgi:hypothetical protein